MNGEIKRLIREIKWYTIFKKHLSEENEQRHIQLLQSKKGEIRKFKRLCEIELANSLNIVQTSFNILVIIKKKQYISIAWGR